MRTVVTPAGATPEDASERFAWMAPVVTGLTVLALASITAAVSYDHEYQLAHRHGQNAWVAALLPFTVDGMILGASIVLLWAAGHGIRRPLRPLAVLVAGIAATIAANLAAGIGSGWLGAGVSAWSGIALILISDVAMWLASARRALARGQVDQRQGACSHPPPPTSVAEALPLARAELQRRGERHGEEALAELFGVSRHQVRTILKPPVAQGVNGDGPAPPDSEGR